VTLYLRSPLSPLVDATVSPILLPSAPLMNPRTLCACHFVTFMISASVAPVGSQNLISTYFQQLKCSNDFS
jgi:hypothetical protein